jgi:hypothetical protein
LVCLADGLKALLQAGDWKSAAAVHARMGAAFTRIKGL